MVAKNAGGWGRRECVDLILGVFQQLGLASEDIFSAGMKRSCDSEVGSFFYNIKYIYRKELKGKAKSATIFFHPVDSSEEYFFFFLYLVETLASLNEVTTRKGTRLKGLNPGLCAPLSTLLEGLD